MARQKEVEKKTGDEDTIQYVERVQFRPPYHDHTLIKPLNYADDAAAGVDRTRPVKAVLLDDEGNVLSEINLRD